VLDREAEYMLFEPGERVLDAVRQRSLIREMHETGLRTVFIAEEGEVLLGYAGVTRLQFRRRRHLGQGNTARTISRALRGSLRTFTVRVETHRSRPRSL
jgi:hypothetical protein